MDDTLSTETLSASALVGAVIDSVADAVYSVDREGRITSWNAGAERIYGWRAAEILGHTFEQLVLPDELQAARARFARAFEGETLRSRGPRPRRDGTTVLLSVTVTPLRRARRVAITGAAVIAHDLTELEVAEQRFAAFAASDPNGVLLIAADGRIDFANQAAADLLGYEMGELPGLPVERLVPGWARDHHERLRLAFLERPEPRRMGHGRDLAAVRKDGSEVFLEIGISSFVTGGQRFASAILVDVSSRLEAEREMRAVNRRLHALFEASPVGIVLSDTEGHVEMANDIARRLMGWDDEDASLFDDAAFGEDQRRIVDDVIPVLERGETVGPVSATVTHGDGTETAVEIHAGPVRGHDHAVAGFVAVLLDVSTRHALERQLIQAQKMETVGRLAGGVAHDFNNVLTAINGFASLLRQTARPEDAGDLDSILAASERAASLTRQLLAFSRQQVLKPARLDVNAVVGGMEVMLRRLVGERVSIMHALRPGLRRVEADRTQLEQVVLNLVVNAADAMPEGGTITIQTDETDIDERAAAARPDAEAGRHVVLAVSDTGTGMDLATQGRIFEPFFTTKGPGKGTGLGLATTYGIVRQSGGHISVESEIGQGTTFRVFLPAAGGADASSSPGDGSGAVILIAEDDPLVREVETLALRGAGHTVLAAANAAEALQIASARTGVLDLLVSDVIMPGETGVTLARKVREIHPETRILLVSGYTEESIGELRGEGIYFLPKPFTPDVLTRTVESLLVARRVERPERRTAPR